MEDEDTPVTLLTNCRFTVCEKIPSDDNSLNKFLTDTLQFKIAGFEPFVIEKQCPSLDDINKLFDALKTSMHSQSRKDGTLFEHHTDLIDPEQKKGNITCEGLMQKSSLQAEGRNKQSTEHLAENDCDDQGTFGASSQIQGSIDELELINNFQGLQVNDVSDDHAPVQVNEFEKSLNGNTIIPEVTSVPVVPENRPENVSSTEQSRENSQVKCESKTQVEKSQKDCLRKQDSVAAYDGRTVQNAPIATEDEIKDSNVNQKQDSQDVEQASENEVKCKINIQEMGTQTKLTAQKNDSCQATHRITDVNKQFKEDEKNKNCESILTEQPCRKSTDHVKCDEDAKPRNEKTITTHDLTTSGQENPIRQNNDSVSSSSKGHKMEYDSKLIKESERQSMMQSQDVKTDRESCCRISRTDITDVNDTEAAIKRQQIVKLQDAKIIDDEQRHEEDKNEHNSIISHDPAYKTTDTTERSFISKMNADDNKLAGEEKNKNLKAISKVESGKDRAHLLTSAENVHQQHDFDVGNQTFSNKISQSDDSEGESQGYKQRETTQFSSRGYKCQDRAESSDSDAESQHYLTYSMKASSLDGLKMYFKESVYDKYFEDAKNEGTSFTFRFNSSDKNAVSFLKELKQLKVEEYDFGHKDYLEAAVKDIQAKKDGLVIQVIGSTVHIVGLRDSVTSAKRKLSSWIQNHQQKINQHPEMIKNDELSATKEGSLGKISPITRKNQEVPRNEISDNRKTHVLVRSQESEHETHLEEPHSPRLGHDFSFHSSSLPVKNNHFGENERNIFTQNNQSYYLKTERISFSVKISKTDITKLEVDCIVNAANKRLQHFGGVAKAICSAAGPALHKECETFRASGSLVAVTDIFISTAGKMPAKCVMHAVGPKWDAYDDNSKPRCFDDLRHTVIRCLVEAGRRGFTSIAFPSISAAIFRVPKEACARCYMEAVKHFGTFNKEPTSLREIYFVDVDDYMVTVIQDHFEKNWTNPCNPHIVQRDRDFASTHFYSPTRNAAQNREQSPRKTASTSVSSKTSGANKSSYVPGNSSAGGTVSSTSDKSREESYAYQIGKYTLCTDSRPAFDLSSDITVTVGKPFDKLSGLRDFRVADNEIKKESVKNKYKLFNVSKPKGHQQKLVCALLPEPDDAERIKQALENLKAVIQNPKHKIFAQQIANVVLTSSILYKEPFQDKKWQQHSYDRKKAGHFVQCLYDFLNYASDIPSISVTVVGCEDALLAVHKVMESRGVSKISSEVQRGARSKTSGSSQHRSEGGNTAQHSAPASGGSGYTRGHHGEGHQRESSRTLESSKYSSVGQFSEPHSRYPLQGSEHHENDGSSVDVEKTTCGICVCDKPCYLLTCCGKKMCQSCQNKVAVCPYCRRFWRVLTGDQPPGTMRVRVMYTPLTGYEQFRTWEVKYDFPSGRQKDCHPHPGEFFRENSRTAYLPATERGFHVLKLLRLAFLRKLTFTIGRSLTTDRENSIIWNDIHHKTSLFSGGLYGYPDSNYLYNVTQELANKGVTLETASADERRNLEHFEYYIVTSGYFTDDYPK